jgi:prefoldin subunit 5
VEHGAVSCLEALAHVGSSAELVPIEREIALLRRSFNSVTHRMSSVDTRKETLRQLLSQVDLKLQELETMYPALTVGPVVYDTSMFI